MLKPNADLVAPAQVDRTVRETYLGNMRVILRFFMIAVLAVLAAGAHPAVAGPAAAAPDGAVGETVMMQMADCQDCTAEQMQASGDLCGSICASPAIGLSRVQEFERAFELATRVSEQRSAVAGQTRRPEPNPPRIS